MTKLISCKALVTFTRYVPGYGMVHGDPDNADAKNPGVPEHKVAEFAAEELVKAPKGFISEQQAAADAEAADVAAAELAAREAAAQAAADAAGQDAPPV